MFVLNVSFDSISRSLIIASGNHMVEIKNTLQLFFKNVIFSKNEGFDSNNLCNNKIKIIF